MQGTCSLLPAPSTELLKPDILTAPLMHCHLEAKANLYPLYFLMVSSVGPLCTPLLPRFLGGPPSSLIWTAWTVPPLHLLPSNLLPTHSQRIFENYQSDCALLDFKPFSGRTPSSCPDLQALSSLIPSPLRSLPFLLSSPCSPFSSHSGLARAF